MPALRMLPESGVPHHGTRPALTSTMTNPDLPTHLAIIMDGNGRWAQSRGLSRAEGHARGARAVRETVRACRSAGIRYLTLYAFSIANWGRPRPEVSALMLLLADFAERERNELKGQDIRLNIVGDFDELPGVARRALQETLDFTQGCHTMTLSLALSYGGRNDIVQAARALAIRAQAGLILPEEIDEQSFARQLTTGKLPAVDMLVRTGGEARVSDFLLFESAYAELVFLPIMWPDFNADSLHEALGIYRRRERRFGLTGQQINNTEGHGFDPADSTSERPPAAGTNGSGAQQPQAASP